MLPVFYNKSQSACLWNTKAGFFSGQVCCWWPLTWWEMKPGLFQEHYALSALFCWSVLNFQEVLYN